MSCLPGGCRFSNGRLGSRDPPSRIGACFAPATLALPARLAGPSGPLRMHKIKISEIRVKSMSYSAWGGHVCSDKSVEIYDKVTCSIRRSQRNAREESHHTARGFPRQQRPSETPFSPRKRHLFTRGKQSVQTLLLLPHPFSTIWMPCGLMRLGARWLSLSGLLMRMLYPFASAE